MIEHKERTFPEDRYRRCKSSDDLTKSDGFRKNFFTGKNLTVGNSDPNVDSPRVLRRAEKYRMAAKKYGTPRSDEMDYKAGSLFFEPSTSPTKDALKQMISTSPKKQFLLGVTEGSRRSSVVFVYSGREQGAKKSFKQWSEKAVCITEKEATNGKGASSPRTRKKSHTQHIKEKVTSFLQNTSVLRRRKKGIDYSNMFHGRAASTMQHTKSLPNFLEDDVRPRSRSAGPWGGDSIWSLASDKNGRKISQTGTVSSNTSSNPGSPATKMAIARSTSMATTRKGLEAQVNIGDKTQSYVDISSRSKDSDKAKFNIGLDGDESDDDLSSYGSESSPYASPRLNRNNRINGAQYSSVIMEQVPSIYTRRPQHNVPSKVAVESRRFPSSIKFQNIRIREIAEEELRINLEGKKFDPEQVKVWSQLVSEGIKERVEYALCGQYKVVVQIYIACLRDKGMSAATQCTFRQGNDSFVIASYRGVEMFALASVFALDFRCEVEVDVADKYNTLLNS